MAGTRLTASKRKPTEINAVLTDCTKLRKNFDLGDVAYQLDIAILLNVSQWNTKDNPSRGSRLFGNIQDADILYVQGHTLKIPFMLQNRLYHVDYGELLLFAPTPEAIRKHKECHGVRVIASLRDSRNKFQKHKIINVDVSKSEYENMLDQMYDRIWDCGNVVYYYK